VSIWRESIFGDGEGFGGVAFASRVKSENGHEIWEALGLELVQHARHRLDRAGWNVVRQE